MGNFLTLLSSRILSDQKSLADSIISIAAIIIAACIAWWIINAIMSVLKKRHYLSPFFEKNDAFFLLIKRAGHYAVLVLAVVGLTRLFKSPVLEKVAYAFMVVLITTIINKFASSLIPYLRDRIVSKTHTKVDDVIFELMEKFSNVIIYAAGIILALDVLGLNIMPFVAGAGIAGIAIGFAAKDTLSNLIAGVLLIIDRPFEIGDRIEVWTAPQNSATWGDVIDIGLRATKIRTTDNIVIIIPNNEIMKRDIINYTTITKEIRVRIPIGIAYDADIKKAKEFIIKVSLELDWVMKEPEPKVVVHSFGDSAVNLQARVWINEPRRRIDTVSYITDRIKEVFQQEGIEIPYPKRDIYIKSEKSFNIS
ncbi:MAG: mechanosensitive ion channel family protein [Proteobacteria bacterium]|nr:mechanosensitive ion channel family protein [Pseudomonadota bacterium]